jgi:chemotaxis protein MotB
MGKKRDDHVCDEGEAWLASFADLLSLLLGFFILLYSLSVMDERKFYEMGKSISSSFQSSDDDGTQEEASVLKTRAKQLKAYQMLVAILNLGDENTAAKKIAQMYSAESEAGEIQGVASAGAKELKELQAKFESKAKDREAPVFEIIIPSNRVFVGKGTKLRSQSPAKLAKLGRWIEAVKDKVSIQVRSWVESKKDTTFAKDIATSSSRAISVASIFAGVGIYNDRVSAEGKVFEPIKKNLKSQHNLASKRREMPEEEIIHIIIYRLPQD